MRRFRLSDERTDEPNITPLIDIVFILLIFFIVSTTFIKDRKLEIERPQASSSTKVSGKEIRVYLDKDGNIYLNGQLVKIWTLQGKIRDLLRERKNKVVLVIADKNAKVETLIEIVDQAKLAGAKDVAVSTKNEAG